MILIARPRPINRGTDRVYRGGGWIFYGGRCRSANRNRFEPTVRFYNLGFRIALRKKHPIQPQ